MTAPPWVSDCTTVPSVLAATAKMQVSGTVAVNDITIFFRAA